MVLSTIQQEMALYKNEREPLHGFRRLLDNGYELVQSGNIKTNQKAIVRKFKQLSKKLGKFQSKFQEQ